MADANKEWVSILGRLGWVLQNLGRPDEQLEMYSKAVEFSPDDPWLIKGVANALRMLGRKKEAAVEYERVLTTLKRVDDSVFSLCLGAWCYYGLEQYKEALPRYISAFYFPGDIHGAQFDFGLALLNAGDAESAYCEYSEILNTLSEKTTISVPRKCGILRVAIFDLRQAISEKPDLKKIRETFAIADLMQDTLHKFSLGLSPDFEFVRVRIAQFLRQGTPLAKLSAI